MVLCIQKASCKCVWGQIQRMTEQGFRHEGCRCEVVSSPLGFNLTQAKATFIGIH